MKSLAVELSENSSEVTIKDLRCAKIGCDKNPEWTLCHYIISHGTYSDLSGLLKTDFFDPTFSYLALMFRTNYPDIEHKKKLIKGLDYRMNMYFKI